MKIVTRGVSLQQEKVDIEYPSIGIYIGTCSRCKSILEGSHKDLIGSKDPISRCQVCDHVVHFTKKS